MKQLSTYIQERLIINKDFNKRNITEVPKDYDELKKIIKDIHDKLGCGTKNNPIDFNGIDTSNITTFNRLFTRSKFEYIDISSWNTSKVDSMIFMFYSCEKLVSIGDIGEWDVSNVKTFRGMFFNCNVLKNIGDLSE